MICQECFDHFIPDDYRDLCNSCGGQLLRQFEAMQEFRAGVMTIAELSGRVVWGWCEQPERCWRVE
jgi:hypothetical protein